MIYRPDIDGLRAIAVLVVVGFHAFPEFFPGGFIGVDIFFVISGFLISSILLESLTLNTFSVWDFYGKRIRRIFPPLIIVLMTSLIVGWFTLLPTEYRSLGKHVIGGASFLSNFFFWSEIDYFDGGVDTKLLLHLWSLAIEEQFYIAWPLLFLLFWKISRYLLISCFILALASFVLNLYFVFGIHDLVAAFYFPLTRYWEILIGACVAIWLHRRRRSLSEAHLKSQIFYKYPNLLSCLGLLLILIGLVMVKIGSNFPGTLALLPTLGAALIVVSGSNSFINKRLLSRKLLVNLGLISYSLYLWHWPILSFARILEGERPSWWIRLGALIISVILSILTYFFVEKPIRFGRYSQIKTIALLAIMIMVACAGISIMSSNGYINRSLAMIVGEFGTYDYFARNNKGFEELGTWEKEYKTLGSNCFRHQADADIYEKYGCSQITNKDNKKILLLGDSHAAYLGAYLEPYYKQRGFNFNQLELATSACKPFIMFDDREYCKKIRGYFLNQINIIKPDYLIVFVHYSYLSAEENINTRSQIQRYMNEFSEFKRLGAKEIIVVGPMPIYKESLPKIITRDFLLKHKKVPYRMLEKLDPKALEFDEIFTASKFPLGVKYVSLRDYLCTAEGCLARVGDDPIEDMVIFDYGHLTYKGAKEVSENLIIPLIK
jgi:peptidoglycan/LPS O-acetylase OafA/YrhL